MMARIKEQEQIIKYRESAIGGVYNKEGSLFTKAQDVTESIRETETERQRD